MCATWRTCVWSSVATSVAKTSTKHSDVLGGPSKCGSGIPVVPPWSTTGMRTSMLATMIGICISLITPVRKGLTVHVSVLKRRHAAMMMMSFCVTSASSKSGRSRDGCHSCPSSACFTQGAAQSRRGLDHCVTYSSSQLPPCSDLGRKGWTPQRPIRRLPCSLSAQR